LALDRGGEGGQRSYFSRLFVPEGTCPCEKRWGNDHPAGAFRGPPSFTHLLFRRAEKKPPVVPGSFSEKKKGGKVSPVDVLLVTVATPTTHKV